MALLIIFVGLTTLTAAAIGGAVAAGTTTAVVAALVLHLVGSVIVIGATLAALGPDGRTEGDRLAPASARVDPRVDDPRDEARGHPEPEDQKWGAE